MSTVIEAVGWNKFFKNKELVAAVKSSGAVSPDARATASNMPVNRPFFPVLKTILSTVFHLGIPRAIEASLKVVGTSFSDSLVVLAMMGIIMMLNAKAPAKAEFVFAGKTSKIKTNSPITIVGNPVNTSFMKPEITESLDVDHSEKKMPVPTPIGMEIRVDKPTITKEPSIAGAIPPPGRFGAVGL